MISLSATLYDVTGCLLLPRARPANSYEGSRRGSVTATLDGRVSVYDSGFSESDQILRVSINHPTQNQLIKLRYLVAYYGQVILSCEIGCFIALLSFSLSGNDLTINLRLISRLSQ